MEDATATTTATTAAAAESSRLRARECGTARASRAERDWMVLADGESVDDARNWLRWDGAEGAGHLYSGISTRGYVNFRPPDFVRGHGDHGGKGAKGAPQGRARWCSCRASTAATPPPPPPRRSPPTRARAARRR